MWGGAVAPLLGSGSSTKGYYLGKSGDGTSYMYVAPKTTENLFRWGSEGITRGIFSPTDGVTNTNTLYGFGNSITTGHPAAYAAKTVTTGGYNTWYLPAKNELLTIYSNKSATPFATNDSYSGRYNWTSTEYNGSYAWLQDFTTGAQLYTNKYDSYLRVRAVRRSIV